MTWSAHFTFGSVFLFIQNNPLPIFFSLGNEAEKDTVILIEVDLWLV